VQHTAAVSRGSGLPRALLQEQAQELLPNYALGLILPEGPILKNSQFDLQLAQAECPDSWDWRTQGLVAAVEDQGQVGMQWRPGISSPPHTKHIRTSRHLLGMCWRLVAVAAAHTM
jgi:hypothetical protein